MLQGPIYIDLSLSMETLIYLLIPIYVYVEERKMHRPIYMCVYALL